LEEQGTTRLSVLVGQNGAPTKIAVATSSGWDRLDDAAMATVKSFWRWESPDKDCRSGVSTNVTIVWNLRDRPGVDPSLLILTAQDSDFPPDALEKGEEGLAVMRVALKGDGTILQSSLAESTGFADLDSKAMELLLHRNFKPGSVDGKPIQSLLIVAIAFLRDNKERLHLPNTMATSRN
jgi:TonB family protein